jgi:hypothetical protein
MNKHLFPVAAAILCAAGAASAQPQQTSATIEDHAITIKYVKPASKNRAAASLHTDADLAFQGIDVPKGDYTLYVLADGAQWQLAVSIATDSNSYDPKLDLGRVPLTMTKSPAPAAACKITLTKTAALAAKLEVAWNDAVASTTFHLDRSGSDVEW